MSAPPTSPVLSYMPQPYEQAYYLGLFNIADEERRGQIAGATAVKFFSRSKLPVDVLKTVWVAADNPPTNFLDHRKFAIAVRLIQLTQNGLKGQGANLSVPGGADIKPAFFDGVSGNLLQMPQQQPPPSPTMQPMQQQQQPQTAPSTQNQQQAPLSPTRQQMHMNAPSATMQVPTPPRPPQQPLSGPPGMHGALTVQDPYTLTPTDQARYEALFAEQCKDDGFVYGSEAVAFFSKSGLPANLLASIWNMTDYPVDNRLDKIEFCVAMHLIICVSKRNLPLPPSLPFSLKNFKSQTQLPATQPTQTMNTPHQQQPGGPSLQQGQNIPPPSMGVQQQSMMTMSAHSSNIPNLGNGMGPPMATNMNDGSRNQYGSSWSVATPSMAADNAAPAVGNLSGLPGPPPLQTTTASISDAFEGLVTGGGDAETVSTYRANTPPVVATASFDTIASSVHAHEPIVNRTAPSLSPVIAPISAPPLVQSSFSSPTQSRKNYTSSKGANESGTSRDTEELRLALQKLQAENISLRARLSTMNGEEDDVRSELVETVSQITILSRELETLRNEVLAAKTRLVEVAGELTAAKEKKRVIKDLINESKVTKSAMVEATNSIESATQSLEIAQAPAFMSNQSNDVDLFSSWGNGDVAPAPIAALNMSSNQQLSVGNTSTVSFDSAYKSTQYPPLEAVEERENENVSHDNFSQPHHQTTSAPSYSQPDPSSFLPRMHLNREPSTGFGDIMGGSSAHLTFQSGTSVDTNETGVEELKQKAKKAIQSLRDAENVAADSESTRRQVAAQADELCRLADEAEKAMREAMPGENQGKKKGILGRRGKKHDAKEAEKLASEARDRKEAFLEIQSQLNDATGLAHETKTEVERLRKAAEDLELEAASAESMQKSAQPPATAAAPVTNGFGMPAASYGNSAGPSGGDMFTNQSMGMGQGFSSNVMGGGGMSIPTPSANDPFANPF